MLGCSCLDRLLLLLLKSWDEFIYYISSLGQCLVDREVWLSRLCKLEAWNCGCGIPVGFVANRKLKCVIVSSLTTYSLHQVEE